MSSYMAAFGRELGNVDVRLGTSVRGIERIEPHYVVIDERGGRHAFEQLIVATSSRDAAALLRGVRAAEEMQAAIAGFRHFQTEIAVHGDAAFMPPARRNWGHINLFFDRDAVWMSDWPGLRDKLPVIRTWLPKGRPPPSPLYASRTYHHLIMTPENAILQQRIASAQGARGLWVTGMYTADVDNHESALLSAVVPVRALAPDAPNLARFLGAVAKDAAHGLEVLPVPLTAAAS
jgi:predicted NAD/FAD-binding protein